MFPSGSRSSIPSNKGKEIMVEEQDSSMGSKSDKEAGTPRWLHALLRTKFWRKCELHENHKNLYRADESVFCIQCFRVVCPYCKHDEPNHQLLKIRRCMFRSVVRVKDMQKLGIDVSHIQTFKCNGDKVVHVRPMKRSTVHKCQAGTPRCMVCNCWLSSAPHLICSLTCKRREDVSPDDFSGPEALHKMAHSKTQEDVQEVTSSNGSLRRRSRKQAKPQRAPFF